MKSCIHLVLTTGEKITLNSDEIEYIKEDIKEATSTIVMHSGRQIYVTSSYKEMRYFISDLLGTNK